MSGTHSQQVTVRLVTKYQFTAEFPSAEGSPSLVFDEAPPLGDGRGPNAAAVLGAAIGNCLSATLANCLSRARVEVDALTAKIITHISRNDEGRYRVAGIDVELSPSVRPGDRAGLERSERIFEDYCTVTESVRQGIPVTVSLMTRDSERDDPVVDR
jgi:uncharacterized OsmC-like protein